MRTILLRIFTLLILVGLVEANPGVEVFLREGRVSAGIEAFAKPQNNPEAFSLALLQTLEGAQNFSRDLIKMGLFADGLHRNLPFLRIAVVVGKERVSEPATPEKLAAAFHRLRTSLRKANQTLSGMDDIPFGVEVDLAAIRLDFDGDGELTESEFLLKTLGPLLGFAPRGEEVKELPIRFDEADAAWLQGYTHLLDGLLTGLMSYDWRPVWNQSAHLLFKDPQPLPPVARFGLSQQTGQEAGWADWFASLHEMRLELVDPQGLVHAGKSFLATIACSRICWARIQGETDDDREWLPSPKQTGPRGSKIRAEEIDAWLLVLDEMEAVLTGRKLLPHWRARPGMGLRLDKIMQDPPKLDLVLLIQGSSLVPYLEEGKVSDRMTWRELQGPFAGGFFRFALWSN